MRKRRQWLELTLLLTIVAVGVAVVRPSFDRFRDQGEDPRRGSQQMARALELYHNQDYPAALQAFDEVLLINPDYLNAYRYRGLTERALGQNVEARADFNRGISRATGAWDWALFPMRLAALHTERARLNLQEGRFADTLEDVDRAQHFSDFSYSLGEDLDDLRARALAGQGEWTEAYDAALRCYSDSPAAAYHREVLEQRTIGNHAPTNKPARLHDPGERCPICESVPGSRVSD